MSPGRRRLDVDRVAGVEPSGVGRTGDPSGVQQAARSLDFVLNRAASGLAKGRTGLVAVVVPNLENQFFTPIVVGAQRWAEGHQLQVTIAANPLLDARQVTASTAGAAGGRRHRGRPAGQ